MPTPEEEAKKALEEMSQRMAGFQAGESYSEVDSLESRRKLKLVIVGVGVILALVAAGAFYMKSTRPKAEIKAPPGYKVVYPKNAPPMLRPR